MTRALLFAVVLAGCGPSALPHGTTAEACGSCHVAQHEAWRGSHHARSTASPVFQALLPRVEAAWGASARARCEACHAPRFGGDEVIGCVTCHGAVGNRGAANGAVVVSLEAPLAGTRVVSNAAHEVEPRGLLRSAVLCGSCHEVHGPGLLEEPTLTEFSASRFASADDCVTCHASSPEGEQRHALRGVDPDWSAADDGAVARASWARALTLDARWRDGSLEVTLTNSGGGHDVPTGAIHLRDVWVDVVFLDGRGERVEARRVLQLGARLERDGAEVALVTDATSVTPRGLAAGASRRVALVPPDGLIAPLRATATLRARAVREDALHQLGLDDLVPRDATLNVSEVRAP